MDLLLDVHETAKALRVCERTVRMLQKTGQIPCVRIGVRVLFAPADLQRWIDTHKTTGSEVEVCQA
jgi:excisionase family DNA binding protein